MFCFFFVRYGAHRDLHVMNHAFPTRRSSDLALAVMAGDEKPTSVRRQGLSGGFAWQAAFLDRVAGDPASLRRQQQRWLDPAALVGVRAAWIEGDRKSTRLNSSH